MPQVCSWSDVVLRYAELNTLPNISSSANQNALIDMAEASVSTRLSLRYTAPFSVNNLTVKDLVIDTLYVQVNLTRQPEKAEAVNNSLKDRFDALLSGSATMITNSGGTAVAYVADVIWSSTENYPPVFGMSDIEKSVVSSEQVYDEDVARGEYL